MAAIDLLKQAVQDARSQGLWALPASAASCFPSADPPNVDLQKFLILAILTLRDIAQQQQQDAADIATIKAKLGL